MVYRDFLRHETIKGAPSLAATQCRGRIGGFLIVTIPCPIGLEQLQIGGFLLKINDIVHSQEHNDLCIVTSDTSHQFTFQTQFSQQPRQ